MDAFIVLHGLMLLTCHKGTAPPTCNILIANTPTHVYNAGFIGTMKALPTPTVKAPLMLSTTLTGNSSAKDPFNTSTPPPLSQRALVLDGGKVKEDRTLAYYAIDIPVPDEVWGDNYVTLDITKALGSTDKGLFKNDLSQATTIRLPETLVLRYRGINGSFDLKTGTTVVASSGEVRPDPTSAATANVLVITSWPNCSSIGAHPQDTFNQMISIRATSGHPAFNATGTHGDTDGQDAGIGSLHLPPAVTYPPSCLSATTKAMRNSGPPNTKRPQKQKNVYMTDIDHTGCGLVANDSP
jgi:hypothetical protein